MVSEENVTEEPNVIIIYKTYTPALKKRKRHSKQTQNETN